MAKSNPKRQIRTRGEFLTSIARYQIEEQREERVFSNETDYEIQNQRNLKAIGTALSARHGYIIEEPNEHLRLVLPDAALLPTPVALDFYKSTIIDFMTEEGVSPERAKKIYLRMLGDSLTAYSLTNHSILR